MHLCLRIKRPLDIDVSQLQRLSPLPGPLCVYICKGQRCLDTVVQVLSHSYAIQGTIRCMKGTRKLPFPYTITRQ